MFTYITVLSLLLSSTIHGRRDNQGEDESAQIVPCGRPNQVSFLYYFIVCISLYSVTTHGDEQGILTIVNSLLQFFANKSPVNPSSP